MFEGGLGRWTSFFTSYTTENTVGVPNNLLNLQKVFEGYTLKHAAC